MLFCKLLEAPSVESEIVSDGLPAEGVAIFFSGPIRTTESLGVALHGAT